MTIALDSNPRGLKEDRLSSHVLCGTSMLELKELSQAPFNLGIVRRELPFDLQECVNALDSQRLVLRAHVEKDFAELFESAFAPLREMNTPEAQWLFNDVHSLSLQFAEFTGYPFLGVLLEVIDGNQCRKFHVDHTHLRLITTYVGMGTEWLDNSSIDRNRLGSDDFDQELKDKARVHKLNAGEVGILKGSAYPDNLLNGVVHKSPAIAGSQEKRLVLRIDIDTGVSE